MSFEYNPNSNNDFVAINIDKSRSYPPSSRLFCNNCNCNLVLLDPKTEEWFCNRCHVSYFPSKGEKVKRANKFETPGPLTDKHGNITGNKKPLIAMVNDDVNLPSRTKSTLPPSMKALKDRPGVSITSFSSTVDNESL
jgi:hypothetical protein